MFLLIQISNVNQTQHKNDARVTLPTRLKHNFRKICEMEPNNCKGKIKIEMKCFVSSAEWLVPIIEFPYADFIQLFLQ